MFSILIGKKQKAYELYKEKQKEIEQIIMHQIAGTGAIQRVLGLMRLNRRGNFQKPHSSDIMVFLRKNS